ncbi:hypothetical protein JX266_013392 [Neoarthrinium moseri]|uniref:uncharacterized protein n=1 Tax=Neoarthrinium moseri TaxID=1658444 RepID=UPI001FDD7A1A|nr:uncharacterized protein JN550_010051 [Neoarthrinium moseri]KAI1840425.1 hypothetical protein JX266_013392 [Neoarthrinium moseri]KAI1862714.1 hypothetical protein JN550_010051 [Neoarthrinium moseri]
MLFPNLFNKGRVIPVVHAFQFYDIEVRASEEDADPVAVRDLKPGCKTGSARLSLGPNYPGRRLLAFDGKFEVPTSVTPWHPA